jgi:enoyl-[acyl-carrier protein] reductase I
VAILGGKIDFVLHSIGMSVNVRKEIIILIRITGIPKGMECAAFHKVMQVLYKNANEWGIVALSYMAAQRVFRIIMICR